MRFFLVIILVLSVFGCQNSTKTTVDVSAISLDITLERFDVDFYNSSKKDLPVLKKKYPYFFPPSLSDSLIFAKINSTDEQELYKETQKIYADINPLKLQLIDVFKHVTYYNSKFKAPKVVTLLTNIDHTSRVIYADSLLLMSLDNYLGSKHPFYEDYPVYIKQNKTKAHAIVDVAKSIIDRQLPPTKARQFIEKCIYQGKKMYLLDRYLPQLSDKEKIGFTAKKLNWTLENEMQIWRYFVDKKMLFSTAKSLDNRFLKPAPFSKFYLEQDALSPGGVGVWVGWQIVRSFMQNNDVSLQQLLAIDEAELFKQSKYKPKK